VVVRYRMDDVVVVVAKEHHGDWWNTLWRQQQQRLPRTMGCHHFRSVQDSVDSSWVVTYVVLLRLVIDYDHHDDSLWLALMVVVIHWQHSY
jgi:hypothetical protein